MKTGENIAKALTFTDPITGREIRQLTYGSRRSVHGYYDLPPWSPKSGRIAFTRMDAPRAEEGEICVMDRDGGEVTVLAHSRAVSPNGGALPQWSMDGARIYFRDREDDRNLIAWVDVESGQRGAYPGSLRMLSPKSALNAYHTVRSAYPDHVIPLRREEHGIFVQDLETGKSEQIVTVEDCWRIHPRKEEIKDWHLGIQHTKWSPGGERIMFVFTNEVFHDQKYGELPRVKDVYVVNADGTGLKRLEEFGHHPLWHPSAKEILTNSSFEGQPSRHNLVLLDADTGQRRLAATCIAGHGHPSFSPDGRYIVLEYVRGYQGYGSICLVDVEADTVEELLRVQVINHTHTGTHLHPVWSRDGQQILYASDASGIAQLCVVNV